MHVIQPRCKSISPEHKNYSIVPTPGLLNLVCSKDNFRKILYACSQHEIKYTK
jgi:hypothetical protein